MCGNSQRQPGREPQRQPPETAPPALPDHHHPNPPNPTAPTTPTTHTNPTNHTAAPTKSSNPATPSTPPTPPPPAAETQKGNTPNNTKNAVLGYPKLQKCGWSPRCKGAQNAPRRALGTKSCKNMGVSLGAKRAQNAHPNTSTPPHPCNTEKP